MVTVGTTQPATFAKTVYSDFGSELSHPGPQLPVDGEFRKDERSIRSRAGRSASTSRGSPCRWGGGANVQDRVSYPSAQLRYTSASVWEAAEICEPAPGTSQRGVNGELHQRADLDGAHFLEGVDFQ